MTKDLMYFKQHAELKEFARKWEVSGERASLLLHRAEAEKWSQWVEAADAIGAMPPPTATLRRFVDASRKQAASLSFRCAVLRSWNAFLCIQLLGISNPSNGIVTATCPHCLPFVWAASILECLGNDRCLDAFIRQSEVTKRKEA